MHCSDNVGRPPTLHYGAIVDASDGVVAHPSDINRAIPGGQGVDGGPMAVNAPRSHCRRAAIIATARPCDRGSVVGSSRSRSRNRGPVVGPSTGSRNCRSSRNISVGIRCGKECVPSEHGCPKQERPAYTINAMSQ